MQSEILLIENPIVPPVAEEKRRFQKKNHTVRPINDRNRRPPKLQQPQHIQINYKQERIHLKVQLDKSQVVVVVVEEEVIVVVYGKRGIEASCQ